MPRRDITDLAAAIRSKYGVDAEILPQGRSRHRKILLTMSDGRSETLIVANNLRAKGRLFANAVAQAGRLIRPSNPTGGTP